MANRTVKRTERSVLMDSCGRVVTRAERTRGAREGHTEQSAQLGADIQQKAFTRPAILQINGQTVAMTTKKTRMVKNKNNHPFQLDGARSLSAHLFRHHVIAKK
jgi:hypothetical protein